jgi:hypothetical protein
MPETYVHRDLPFSASSRKEPSARAAPQVSVQRMLCLQAQDY